PTGVNRLRGRRRKRWRQPSSGERYAGAKLTGRWPKRRRRAGFRRLLRRIDVDSRRGADAGSQEPHWIVPRAIVVDTTGDIVDESAFWHGDRPRFVAAR